jgi:hypothetical protein
MAFITATTSDIVRGFINDRLLEIAKVRHRKNHNANDENYTNVVIRQGWTYIAGADADETEIHIPVGITYDDYPTALAISIGLKETVSGAPTNPHDFDTWVDPPVVIQVGIFAKDEIYIHMKRTDGSNLVSTEYYGVSWMTIGKKA